MKDLRKAKTLCDQLNSRGIRVDGYPRSLTIGVLVDGEFRNLSSHQLEA